MSYSLSADRGRHRTRTEIEANVDALRRMAEGEQIDEAAAVVVKDVSVASLKKPAQRQARTIKTRESRIL